MIPLRLLGRPSGIAGRARKRGLSPGSVVHTGERKVERATIDVIEYGPDGVEEVRDATVERAIEAARGPRAAWIDVVGLHDVGLLERLGGALDLHPLTLEDVASVGQRAKLEPFDAYLYLVLRMLDPDGGPGGGPRDEQLSIVLLPGAVVTFQERPGDPFEALRERIRTGKGRVRRLGADYLAYALVDVVVDGYFALLEAYGDRVARIEESVAGDPDPATMGEIGRLKRDLLFARRAIWPVRDLLSSLQREESDLTSDAVETFLRDAHDHAVQAAEMADTLREVLSGLQDAYLSVLSFRMNETMRVLTMISTIFIPLSFLAAVYGMNFDRMPELRLPWAYPALWALMVALGVAMLMWFRRRGWW